MSRHFDRYMIVLLIILILAANVLTGLWIINNRFITGADSIIHTYFSLEYYYRLADILRADDIGLFSKIAGTLKLLSYKFADQQIQYPSFLYFVTAWMHFFFGKSFIVAKLGNFLYILILLISVYNIGKLLKSRLLGATAAFLVLMYPPVFQLQRQFGLDLTVTAFFSLAILLFIKSEYFADFQFTIYFAVVTGILMLIKGQVIVVLLPIILLSFKAAAKDKKRLKNILFFTIAAALIALIWWGVHLKEIKNVLLVHLLQNDAQTGTDSYMSRIVLYFNYVISGVITWPLFLIFIPSFYVFIKDKIDKKYIFIVWLVFPFIVFMLILNKVIETRYFMIILPVIALITAYSVVNIKNMAGKIAVFSVMIIIAFGQFCIYTFSRTDDLTKNHQKPDGGIYGGTRLFENIGLDCGKYKTEEVYSILRNHKRNGKLKILQVFLDANAVDSVSLQYWFRVIEREQEIVDLCINTREVLHNFASFDFIILKVPSRREYEDWPPQDKFDNLIKNSTLDFIYHRMERESVKDEVFQKLYSEKNNYNKIGKVSTNIGFDWILYQRKNS